MRALACTVLVLLAAAARGSGGTRHGFYRELGDARRSGSGRRVFGGAAASLDAWSAACALLDRYWATRCSGSVLSPRWALTAAHCVSPRVAYVKYNARRPAADGDAAPVHSLYRHPGYRVEQRDEGRGPDVTALHHDLGLVRTRTDMLLRAAPPEPPLLAMRRHNPTALLHEEVQVLGFGRTERSTLGEELYTVRLRLVPCERSAWMHCVCGAGGADGARGVCAGDSGGPVVVGGALVGVTSMGPVECGAEGAPPAGATSVFTALYPYADVVNATIYGTETALRMTRISAAPARSPAQPPLAGALLLALAARR